jgi:hypothetical protein
MCVGLENEAGASTACGIALKLKQTGHVASSGQSEYVELIWLPDGLHISQASQVTQYHVHTRVTPRYVTAYTLTWRCQRWLTCVYCHLHQKSRGR